MKSENLVQLGFSLSLCVTSLVWEFPLQRKWNSCFDDSSHVILKIRDHNAIILHKKYSHWNHVQAFL